MKLNRGSRRKRNRSLSAGKIIIISGPSGVGKSTLIRELARRISAKISVSVTTRSPGISEKNGADYHFVSKNIFEDLIKENKLLEYTEYLGNYYGTPLDPVRDILNSGKDVILGIEARGAKEVAKKFPDAIIICLCPPSDRELARRIKARGRDDEPAIQKRIENAKKELELARNSGIYKHWVINDDLDQTVDELVKICKQESNKNDRSPER